MQFCFTRIIGKEMLEAPYRSEKDLCILENSQNTAPIGTSGPRLPAPPAGAISFSTY